MPVTACKPRPNGTAFIASLLGIQHIIVAVNKMDLVDDSEGDLQQNQTGLSRFTDTLDLYDIRFIPLSSGLDGDNVVNRSENMPWFNVANR